MIAILALVLPLGLDTFAVSAALGVAGLPSKRRLRVALLFCAFEAAMPLIGLALGAPLGEAIGAASRYLAIVLLLAVGLFALLADDDHDIAQLLSARGAGVLLLALSVSLDELAIGFTLGLLRLPTVWVIALIGAQAFVVAQLGLRLGARVGERVRERIERLAGIALVAVALVLLAEEIAR